MRVLVLAGTSEARRLVEVLVETPDLEVEAALAGRTSSPVDLHCPVRVGPFGGVEGLRAHLVARRIDALVDATHPFARTMPDHARSAATAAGIPRLRLRRPPFTRADGDRWLEVDDVTQAVATLRGLGARRALLTIGRSDVEAFCGLPDVALVARSIERVELPGVTAISARGPFSVEEERRLLRRERIDALVTKDSGGDDAKLRAARAEGVPVVLLRRPADVDGPLVEDVESAIAWIDRQRPPTPGPHGGDVQPLARWLGVRADAVLDLSASLNPFAPDVGGLLARSSSAVARYPDPTEATDGLAAALDVDPAVLVLTNGGAEAISLVAARQPSGWVEDPEFSLYRRHLAEVRPDAPRWRSNPSNPLGRLAPEAAEAGVWDEAFYPLATGAWSRGDGRAWRLGSLTKVWACPGLRLGYVIAPTADDAEAIRASQPRWSVNGLALAVVPELLAQTELARWAAAIGVQRVRLLDALGERGLAARDTDACWVLVDEPGLRDQLARRGVLVRDCTSFGLPGTARVAVPDDAGLARLLAALDARPSAR
jgi:precorrin-6x reductase